MDIFLAILAIVLIIIGFIGDVLPVIPGTIVTYAALIVLHFTNAIQYSAATLIVTGVLCVVITLMDYIVPAWGTKKFGGTKSGVRGSTIGLIVSVVVLPILGITIGPFGLVGLLAGPFVGAYCGEKLAGVDDERALRSAFGSFIGFLAGTFMKLSYTFVICFMIVRDLVIALIR